MKKWWGDIVEALRTISIGMGITWRHLFTDSTTLQYPEQKWQLPPRSRMRLFMKFEDCIGCGQCARACPVDCIHIEAGKRDKEAGPIFAANGMPIKLDVTVFDIDMSLCCYCNLCVYPCPTDCIYMTPEYEFASTDLGDHLYRFAKPDAKFLTENPKKKAAPPAVAPPKPAPPAATPPKAPPPVAPPSTDA
jgi:NADH-quinone oxidoreductase subunit I